MELKEIKKENACCKENEGKAVLAYDRCYLHEMPVSKFVILAPPLAAFVNKQITPFGQRAFVTATLACML